MCPQVHWQERGPRCSKSDEGSVAALYDRCPHRGVPLSQGQVLSHNIECPYHGFQFNRTGRCVHIPTQEHIPQAVCTRGCPVVEKMAVRLDLDGRTRRWAAAISTARLIPRRNQRFHSMPTDAISTRSRSRARNAKLSFAKTFVALYFVAAVGLARRQPL
jgi:nitrite reductase/ring-hydroxylating ferredoxin subunit